jgi:glycosyltransferase involved in cell wall biosynthesis
MRLLQVAPYDVFPPIDGASSRSHGLVSAFPKNGDEVIRFCQRGPVSRIYKLYQNGKQFDSDRFRRSLKIAEDYYEIRSQNPLNDIASVPALFGYPQVLIGNALNSPISHDLNEYISWSDVVMIEKPWQFSAVAQVCEDVPIVYSSHDVVTELYSEVQEKGFGNWFFTQASKLEQNAVVSADMILCTSKRDKEMLKQLYSPQSPIVVAPNAVKKESIRTANEEQTSLRASLGVPTDAKIGLFVGGAHQPNVDAVHRLVEVANEFDANAVCFLIAGSAGNDLDSTPDNVVSTGYVEDLEPFFNIANFGLNPIQWGGGTNIKMLDYLARALPVISTEFGARGFDLTSQKDVLIRPVSEFPEAIEMLVENQNLCQRIGKNAQQFVRNDYIWERVSQLIREEIRCNI